MCQFLFQKFYLDNNVYLIAAANLDPWNKSLAYTRSLSDLDDKNPDQFREKAINFLTIRHTEINPVINCGKSLTKTQNLSKRQAQANDNDDDFNETL